MVQPITITKKMHRKKESLLRWSYKRRYSSHIAAFFSTAAIVSTENDIFIAAGSCPTAISKLPPLKHIYCIGFMSCHYRMMQKTIPIVTVQKNATIGPTYNDGPKKTPQYVTYNSNFCTRHKKPPQ